MVEILSLLQQYVPSVKKIVVEDTEEIVDVPQELLYKVLLGGDQLTVPRARSANIEVELIASGSIVGLISCVEDWHARSMVIVIV